MKKITLLVIGLLVVCIHAAVAGSGPPGCMAPTVVDGYVKDPTGTVISGATVAVTTSATDCNSWSTSTDINGYYSIPGLNIESKTVTSSANKSTEVGSNSSYSSGSTLRLNIQACAPPTAPTLTDQTNTHHNNVNLSWTIPGTGFYGEGTSSVYNFNSGGWTVKTSPQTQSGLTYLATYTWQVKTRGYCDSAPSSDSFTITNQQPSAPNQTHQPSSHSTNATLCWTSGNDTDTDPVDIIHDEFYFGTNSNPEVGPIHSNTSIAIPPTSHCIYVSNLSYGYTYYWKVKTCDNTGASNACNSATDSFTVGNSPPSSPTLTSVKNVTSSNASLAWVSGIDPDGDPTYDVYEFGVDGSYTTIVNPATSPQDQTGLIGFTKYTWHVKSCDIFNACSSWVADDFIVCFGNGTCPACPAQPTGGGSCGGGGSLGVVYQNVTVEKPCPAGFILDIRVPPGVRAGQDFALQIILQKSSETRNGEISVEAPEGIRVNKENVNNLGANEEVKKILVGHVSDTVSDGVYNIRIKIDMDGQVVYRDVALRVAAPGAAICGDGVCGVTETLDNCFIDCYSPTARFFAGIGGGIVAWATMLGIAIAAMIYHLFGDATKKAKDLEHYIHSRLKRGERPGSIRNKLVQIGYTNKRVTDVYNKIRRKHGKKLHKGESTE